MFPALTLLLFYLIPIDFCPYYMYRFLRVVKNLSSSTSHKKNSFLSLHNSENVRKIFLAHSFLSKPNPSPKAFPKLCERFSPTKGRVDGSIFCSLDMKTRRKIYKIKYDLMRSVLCYGELMRFLKLPIFWSKTTFTFVYVEYEIGLINLCLNNGHFISFCY